MFVLCICVWLFGVRRSKNDLWGLALSYHRAGLRDWTQVSALVASVYLLSDFIGPPPKNTSLRNLGSLLGLAARKLIPLLSIY